ncbi:MAG: methyltransferase domain-containing protein [Patescibacteria group bacterium]
MEKKSLALERQLVSKEQLREIELSMIRQEHIKRYASIRRFCYGKVLDCACGSGYGSFLISGNPDVEHVTGADINAEAVVWAQKEYGDKKNKFIAASADTVKGKFDTLVTIETIEHIKDSSTIPTLVERCKIDNLIISFPDKKTMHYNTHHMHDFVRQEIVDLFPNHVVYHVMRFTDSTTLMMIRLPKKAPHDLFKNIRDIH